MRSRPARVALLAAGSLLLPGLLAGCDGAKKADRDPDAARDPIAAGDRYVALGDSYTSAPGVGTPTGPAGCLRTDRNYPHLVAEELDLKLTDVSCGGAKTENMTSVQHALADVVPPQLDAVTKDTDLVTLSIGANNGAVYGTLVLTCARLAVADPAGAPCSDLAQKDPSALPAIFAGVKDDIVDIIGKVQDRAPGARVVVVGYPQIVPAEGTCAQLPLGAGDYPFARGVLKEFVEAQQEAADEAGVEYVDVWSASEGHDICGEDPWVAGVKPERAATAYHPYAEAQEAVAGLVEDLVGTSGN